MIQPDSPYFNRVVFLPPARLPEWFAGPLYDGTFFVVNRGRLVSWGKNQGAIIGDLMRERDQINAHGNAIDAEWQHTWKGKPEAEGYADALTAYNADVRDTLEKLRACNRRMKLKKAAHLIERVITPKDGPLVDPSQSETFLLLEPQELLEAGETPVLDTLTDATWLSEVAKRAGLPFSVTRSIFTGTNG